MDKFTYRHSEGPKNQIQPDLAYTAPANNSDFDEPSDFYEALALGRPGQVYRDDANVEDADSGNPRKVNTTAITAIILIAIAVSIMTLLVLRVFGSTRTVSPTIGTTAATEL